LVSAGSAVDLDCSSHGELETGWDDTGITAGAILILTGYFGMTIPHRPWLWALAVGIWIPVQGILQDRNFGLITVLIVAFIGAYAGALVRKALIALR
jgi:fructose-specific phosphotransferase system IIC component